MDTFNYLSSFKKIGILILICGISSTINTPVESFAAWDCFRTLHKEAISDAINVAPTDLKNVLTSNKDTMLKQVDVIHEISKPQRKSFKSYYKDIVEVAKDCDAKRNEYVAKYMTDITIYVFDFYCPIKLSFCNENEVLKRVSVIYDGYSLPPDYSNTPQHYFEENKTRALQAEIEIMTPFYNKLVNEILDLWVSIWKDAGRDISGLPQKNTILKEAKNEVIKESIKESDLSHIKGERYSDKDLIKNIDKTKIYTNDDLNNLRVPISAYKVNSSSQS